MQGGLRGDSITCTGYGAAGPWKDKPGQDLLVQSLSGLAWLSGDADQGPVPTGVSVVDIMTGAHLAQGILAALVGRSVTGNREVMQLVRSLDSSSAWAVGTSKASSRPNASCAMSSEISTRLPR